MAPRDIVEATAANCIHFQALQAAYHRDAVSYARLSRPEDAVHAQNQARVFYNLAWERLARLIGA